MTQEKTSELPKLLRRNSLEYTIGVGLRLTNYEQIELESEGITRQDADERLAKKAQETKCEVVTNYSWSSKITSLEFESEKPTNIEIRRKYYASGTGLRER